MSSITSFQDISGCGQETIKYPKPFKAIPRLAVGLSSFSINKRQHLRITASASNVTRESARFEISTWGDTSVHAGALQSLNIAANSVEFLTGDWFRDKYNHDVPASKRIDFQHDFEEPPIVLAFFNKLDIRNGSNIHVKTYASDIDEKGFTLTIEPWGDTYFYGAQASWVAYSRHSRDIFGISVNTEDVRPWNKPQEHTKKTISFPEKMTKTPSVFMALNYIDIGNNADSYGLEAYATDASPTQLTWHFDSYRTNATVYAAGASIFAIVTN